MFQRLSKDVAPTHYLLRLKPNLKTFTFEGSETIEVQIHKATSSVTINSCDIEVQEVSYQPDGSDASLKGVVSYQKENETVQFTFPTKLSPGTGKIFVAFTGELNDKMKGFYRSKYTVPNGEERFAAVTQFEATDARRAFPCWDEPAVKATFDVTLVVPKDRIALSNMPVVSEVPLEVDAEWKVVTYAKTPIMSTYLLAFIVGEFDYLEDRDSDGILVRVYTPLGKKEQGRFALKVAVETLPFYKEYFKIAYPLPKMDLIAIADFAAGAMENWGLITYRETYLLVDPEESSVNSRKWVALVVGHEIAHQWFGNLVTMEWWTHLWLNEGFASWIMYLCVDHLFPEFDIWSQFVSEAFGKALQLDALHSSHPIEVPVGHPDEVNEIFDVISYSKGASVIRMLHDYIGDADFRKGMNTYLTELQYKNAFTEDLWRHLGKASGKPVKDIMSKWTGEMGFPIITVEESQDGNNRVLKLTQKKFCADGEIPTGPFKPWMVPISVCTTDSPDSPVKNILLDSQSTTVTLEDFSSGKWVKLNSGTVGFYRVQYTSDALKAFIPAIKNRSLPLRDRLGLENDLFALARAGMCSVVDVLKVSEAYINENEYTVWSDLSANLAIQGILLQYTEGHADFLRFTRDLYRQVYNKVGWVPKATDGPLDAMLRELVITTMGNAGDPDVVAEAKKRFSEHVSGTTTLPADLRTPVYQIILKNGDEGTFNTMMKMYKDTELSEERDRIGKSLGKIKSTELKKRVLEFSMSDGVRSQDTINVIIGVTDTKEGRELAWQFVQNKWENLRDRYKGPLLARLVKPTTENFVTEERAAEIETFFQANPAPSAERGIQQACENIRLNVQWKARDSANVVKFLKDRQ